MSEYEKMCAGESFDAGDPILIKKRVKAHKLCAEYNLLSSGRGKQQKSILSQLLPNLNSSCYIEPRFCCDYGDNINFGNEVYLNFNCTILDCAEVSLGDRVKLGPNVQLYTVNHPLDAKQRASGMQVAKAITIAEDVWIGGGVIVLPGVSIGARSVIGAGSVVTKDVPADVVAMGSPCRVERSLI